MKVLFLDVDGVLNRESTKERVNGFMGLDKELVSLFTSWYKTHAPEVDIVLSSSWRLHSAFTDALRASLDEAGIKWIDVTPDFKGVGRTLEIRHWVSEHPEVTHYAVLDDMVMFAEVAQHHVQTSESKGLRVKDLTKLNKLLDLSL